MIVCQVGDAAIVKEYREISEELSQAHGNNRGHEITPRRGRR